ncbi:unnamed protein product [Timema podura]|uniref:Uncharacterized protein n=1 Tax=Timema podura TaxID=61482 RepID=A0ABN7NLW8_TIMPD|nr:unnamed protein product [Timema podura]
MNFKYPLHGPNGPLVRNFFQGSNGPSVRNFSHGPNGPLVCNFSQSHNSPLVCNFSHGPNGPSVCNFSQNHNGPSVCNFSKSPIGPSVCNFSHGPIGPLCNFSQSHNGPLVCNFSKSPIGPSVCNFSHGPKVPHCPFPNPKSHWGHDSSRDEWTIPSHRIQDDPPGFRRGGFYSMILYGFVNPQSVTAIRQVWGTGNTGLQDNGSSLGLPIVLRLQDISILLNIAKYLSGSGIAVLIRTLFDLSEGEIYKEKSTLFVILSSSNVTKLVLEPAPVVAWSMQWLPNSIVLGVVHKPRNSGRRH